MNLNHPPVNQLQLRGCVIAPAQLFLNRRGQPRLTFRLEVRCDDRDLPPKKPAGVDYFSVVAFGPAFIPLQTQLVVGREVHLTGRLRSRDIESNGVPRVVIEVVAKEIIPLGSFAP